MSSTIATDLFAVMEKQMGAEAARAAAAAYLANSQGSAAPSRPPMSAEHKAKLKAGREAALAKKAAEKAAGASSPEEPAAEKAPRPPMSEEHKAKLKAGREAALAKKAAEKAAGAPAPEPSPPAEPKKRGPKPLAAMNAEELAVHKAKVVARAAAKALVNVGAPAAAPSPSAAADPTVFAPFTHKGAQYLRNSRGDLLTPEYEWVGRYDGKAIDTKFPKPADLEDEGSAADE
jgi:hypothetical protein